MSDILPIRFLARTALVGAVLMAAGCEFGPEIPDGYQVLTPAGPSGLTSSPRERFTADLAATVRDMPHYYGIRVREQSPLWLVVEGDLRGALGSGEGEAEGQALPPVPVIVVYRVGEPLDDACNYSTTCYAPRGSPLIESGWAAEAFALAPIVRTNQQRTPGQR